MDENLIEITSESLDEADAFGIEFTPAQNASDFQRKAADVFSDALDLLKAKIRGGMAEASDIKTALEVAKMYKIGIESVDEVAEKARREIDNYGDKEFEDVEEYGDSMRFDG